MAEKSLIADQSPVVTVASSSSGEELQSKVDRLANALSNLNPNAKEFIPAAAHQLSAVAPNIGDGSSSSSRPSHRVSTSLAERNAVGQNESKIRRTIYIPDVPENVTEWDLAMHFKLCGIIKECRICGNIKSPLRLAFIEFSNESEARVALSLSGKPILGVLNENCLKILPSKTVILPVNKRFLPKSNHEMERVYKTIYCTNIDNRVPQTQLVDFFEQFCGEVTEFKVLYDPKHSSCIAFIEFSQWEAATSALRYSGTFMGDLPIRISPSKTAVKSVPYRWS